MLAHIVIQYFIPDEPWCTDAHMHTHVALSNGIALYRLCDTQLNFVEIAIPTAELFLHTDHKSVMQNDSYVTRSLCAVVQASQV